MSGVKHTPGERLVGYAEPGHPIYKPGTEVIRIVERRAPGQTEFVKVALVDSGQANARLIATAPDLLEAGAELQAARKAQKLAPSAENLSRVRIASDAFDAAIARARGEQSPNYSDTGAQP